MVDPAQPVPEADEAALTAVLRQMGFAEADEQPRFERLTGGVSSDIFKVETRHRVLCMKRALPKLRVETDWFAPVERNAFEAAWMLRASQAVAGSTPALLGHDPAAGLLVMAYLEPERYRLWKTELRHGRAEPETAAAVGTCLARIHAANAGVPEVAAAFSSDAIFQAIRLEPYLLATARAHPDLDDVLKGLAMRTAATRLTLVHGDISPKNILIGAEGPVFLDAECAWYGDPAFDLAFCLNHLLLKCLWIPHAAAAFLRCFGALAEGYVGGVDWEPRAALEARVATLLPALLLARVDGTSPVEYLTNHHDKAKVRRMARAWLERPAGDLEAIRQAWGEEIGA